MRALVVAILLLPLAAEAESLVRFDYTVDELTGCPDEAELVAAVSERLGRNPFSPEAPFGLSCALGADDSGARAVVSIHDDRSALLGVRDLHVAGSCNDLLPAVVLALALAIDGLPGPVLPVQARDDETPPPEIALVAAGPTSWHAQVGSRATVGHAPGIGGGVVVQVGRRRGDVSTGLEAEVDLPSAQAHDAGSVSVQTFALFAVACGHLGSLAACGRAGAGGLIGAGHDLRNTQSRLSPTIALGARLQWEVRLGRSLGLRLHADLELPLTHTTLTVDGQEVWTTPVVGGAGGLSLVRHFP